MLGALAGDIIGSVYEWHRIKTVDFPLFSDGCSFTDDSVLTVALADAILSNRPYGPMMRQYYTLYPYIGYGPSFQEWVSSTGRGPFNSCGNGAAMRISPVGFAYDTLDEVLTHAREFTEISHSHPEGIKGAQATASAIFLARTGKSKEQIREYITDTFSYDLTRTCDDIRPNYFFDATCQGSVPESITAFLDSRDFENAIRLAISLGGDSDTMACITGGIAQAFYGGVPPPIAEKVLSILDDRLRDITVAFMERYCDKK